MSVLRRTTLLFVVSATLGLSALNSAQAQFVTFDDFDSLVPDTTIHGQNGWTAETGDSRDIVGALSETGNQIFEVVGRAGNGQTDSVWKSLGANTIINGDSASTLYTRFLVPEGSSPGITMALRNGPVPDTSAAAMGSNVMFLDSGASSFTLNSANGVPGDIVNQASFENLETASAVTAELEKGTWYDLWMVTDSNTNTFNLYVQGGSGDFTTQTQLQVPGVTDINFRDFRPETSTADVDLDQLWLRANVAHDDGAILFDNMHISDAEDLSTPTLTAFAEASLVVDRDTGSITLMNHSSAPGSLQIQGYSITSASGALNSLASDWRTIGENYDSDEDQSVDTNDDWTILSARQSGNGDLSEFQFGGTPGDGGVLTIGQSISLSQAAGQGAWLPTNVEDLVAEIVLPNGLRTEIPVAYTGNGGESFKRSDFDRDGSIGISDWDIFIANDLADVSGVSSAMGYTMGDVNRDGTLNLDDFILFEGDYDADNGAGSFRQMLQSVPEPSAVFLMGLCVLGIACTRCRAFRLSPAVVTKVVVAILGCSLASDAKADWAVIDNFESIVLTGLNADGTTPVLLNAEDNSPQHPDTDPDSPFTENSDGGWIVRGHRHELGNNGRIWTVTTDPVDPGNKVLSLFNEYDTTLVKPIPSGGLANNVDAQGTLFFRYNIPNTNNSSISVGLTSAAASGGPGSVGPLVIPNDTGGNVNNSRIQGYDQTDTDSGAESVVLSAGMAEETWYNVWLQLDETDVVEGGQTFDGSYSVHISGGDFGTTPTQIGTDLVFRSTIDALDYLHIRPNNNNSGDTILFDDFYFNDTEMNLDYPAPGIEPSLLKAMVHPTTGMVILANDSSSELDLNSYEIISDLGGLETGDSLWNSLSDQGLDSQGAGSGENWQESGAASDQAIGERFLLGSTLLEGGDHVSIGTAYDPVVGDAGLTLRYSEANIASALDGVVEVIVPGDMDGNGLLEDADVNAFVLALTDRETYTQTYGNVFPDLVGDFNGNGKLDLGDVADFKAAVLSLPGSGASGNTSVPEPTGLLLLLASISSLPFLRVAASKNGRGVTS